MSDAQPNPQDDLLDGLLGDFLDESDQLLAQLNDNLLRLDASVRSPDEDRHAPCDVELLNEMFRAAHSLKGLSAMLGLTEINTLTHKIENVFDAARSHQLALNADVVDLVFLGIDQLTALVELLKDPDGEPVDCRAVIEGIRQLLCSAGAERKQTSQADADKVLSVEPSETKPDIPDPLEGLCDDEDVSEDYLSIFIDETETALDELSETLLAAESAPDPRHVNRLLVISHKIKGSAASIGLNRVARLAHLMEDLLQNLVEAGAALPREASDALLACVDALHQFVTQRRAGTAEPDHFSEAARKLAASRSSGTGSSFGPLRAEKCACPPPAQVEGQHEQQAGGEPRARSDGGSADEGTTFAGEVWFDPDLTEAGLKAVLIYEKLAKLGRVTQCDPPTERLDELDRLEAFRFRVISGEPAETIVEQVRVSGVREASVSPVAAEAPPPPPCNDAPRPANQGRAADKSLSEPPSANTKQPAVDGAARPAETVRVDIERLDELMNLAGQLVINKAQFTRIGDKLKTALSGKRLTQSLNRAFCELEKLSVGAGLRIDALHLQAQVQHFHAQARRIRDDLETVREEMQAVSQARNSVKDLLETIHQFDRVSNAIQQAVMDTRMVPIGPLFTRFNRVIRDIARERGKEIRLTIEGEKTELDKRMIDELSDPLIHMVRNAADHGIESPDARERAGKPRQGTVALDACHRGNSIVIQVSDDGKGLDADRILRKCLERGILTEADAEKMTPRQLYQMIWVPGMSTAEKVTGVSGRGMGMDIVKSKIEALNGVVDIESAPGRGTTMTIKLPVTLAILPSLMVDIAGDVFAMPMEAVTEIVSVGRDRLNAVHGQLTAIVRGRVVSLVRLDEILAFHRPKKRAETSQSREITLVIVGDPGQEVGLAVDRVVGEEDIVIKSIAENYRNVPGIAGASILGDGRVSLILDIQTLIEMASRKASLAPC